MTDKDKEELEKKLQDYESDWIKMRDIAEKMQAENKKLREALMIIRNTDWGIDHCDSKNMIVDEVLKEVGKK